MALPTRYDYKNALGGSSIGVGYCACGCLSSTIYCAVAPIRKCGCEGRYHGDGVATKLCNINIAIVGVKGNPNWKVSHRYGAYNSVCRAVNYRDGVTDFVCHIHIAIIFIKGNVKWIRSHGYSGHNGVCCPVDNGDGVATNVCHIQITIVRVKGNANWTLYQQPTQDRWSSTFAGSAAAGSHNEFLKLHLLPYPRLWQCQPLPSLKNLNALVYSDLLLP